MLSKKTTKKRASFQLLATDASQVCVAGTFNDWDPVVRPLKRGKDAVRMCMHQSTTSALRHPARGSFPMYWEM